MTETLKGSTWRCFGHRGSLCYQAGMLPLIVAAGNDPGLALIDLRRLDESSAAEVCDRIEATGALDQVRARATGLISEAKAGLVSAGLDPEQRRLLELIADGVVLRYS